MRRLVILGIALILGTAAAATPQSSDPYLILTNLPADDPNYKAVEAFKKSLHPEASIIRFSTDDWDALGKDLKRLKPQYAVLVLKPETLDINFQAKFLVQE